MAELNKDLQDLIAKYNEKFKDDGFEIKVTSILEMMAFPEYREHECLCLATHFGNNTIKVVWAVRPITKKDDSNGQCNDEHC